MKWVRDRVRRHGGKLSLLVGLALLGAAVGLIVAYWGWLADGQPGSTAVRNVGLVAGGAIALWIAIWRGIVANQQARAADQQAKANQHQAEAALRQAKAGLRQAETAQADLRNRRYQDGAAMLGDEVLLVRFAGIYALERLAQDVPEEYHIEGMKMLCAFVRNPTRDGSLEGDKMRVDVQAAMDAICSCHARHLGLEADADFELDLRQADLRGLVLTAQDLSNSTNLSEAQLDSAYLRGVKLMGAQLIAAELRGVDFLAANLSGADFTYANLHDALLQEANISGALFALPLASDETPAPGSATGLTQTQLDLARADPDNEPYLEGVLDAETGEQLEWRGWTLDMKRRLNHPEGPE